MRTDIYKIQISKESIMWLLLVISLLLILRFVLSVTKNHMKSLGKEERENYIKNFFLSFDVLRPLVNMFEMIFSSLLYVDKTKKTREQKAKPLNNDEKKLKKIDDYLEEEYASAKTIRRVFINLFFISTISVICAFIWLDEITYGVRVTIGGLYFGLSLFVYFVIKSCYARTAVIFSILEDKEKKADIKDFLIKYKKSSELKDNDIELIKNLTISRAEREKSAKHPYEIILKNVAGSSISFGNSKLKISEEEKKNKSS